jgi:hypothetical protein
MSIVPCSVHEHTSVHVQDDITVYLSASKLTFGTDLYRRSLDYIAQGFPNARILDAASQWTSAEHWRAEYQSVLSPVTHAFILPNSAGYCGRGVYTEWDYLRLRVQYCAAFVHDDTIWTPIELPLIDPYDWVNFAVIRHLPTGRLSVPGMDLLPGMEMEA